MAATMVLAGFTVWLVLETKSAAKKQLGVNTWLYFINRWDSKQMKAARTKLAWQLQVTEENRSIDDTVLDYFEQVGTTFSTECIDKKLVWSALSWDAVHWWAALEKHVKGLRLKFDDITTYAEFEALVRAMNDPPPDQAELDRYLKDETELA